MAKGQADFKVIQTWLHWFKLSSSNHKYFNPKLDKFSNESCLKSHRNVPPEEFLVLLSVARWHGIRDQSWRIKRTNLSPHKLVHKINTKLCDLKSNKGSVRKVFHNERYIDARYEGRVVKITRLGRKALHNYQKGSTTEEHKYAEQNSWAVGFIPARFWAFSSLPIPY